MDLSFPTRMRPSLGYCESGSSSMSYKTIKHALKSNIIDFSHEVTHHMGRRDNSLSSNSSKGLKGRQHNHTNARYTRQMHIPKYTTRKYRASPKTYLKSKLKQYQPQLRPIYKANTINTLITTKHYTSRNHYILQ